MGVSEGVTWAGSARRSVRDVRAGGALRRLSPVRAAAGGECGSCITQLPHSRTHLLCNVTSALTSGTDTCDSRTTCGGAISKSTPASTSRSIARCAAGPAAVFFIFFSIALHMGSGSYMTVRGAASVGVVVVGRGQWKRREESKFVTSGSRVKAALPSQHDGSLACRCAARGARHPKP